MVDEPREQRNDESAGQRAEGGSSESNRTPRADERRATGHDQQSAEQARRFGAQDLDDSMSGRGGEDRGEMF